MTSETRSCQNCKTDFVIEPDDFAFYERIQVPPPTFCPECRMRRRMVFMNERTFYKRKCDLCAQEVISVFSPDSKYTVYCNPCWWSDKWNPADYGREYDPDRSFWEQMRELFERVPKSARETIETSLVNSDYCNICSYLKNCYLLFNSDYSEDSMYSTYLERSKMSADIYMGDFLERCYESHNLYKDNNVRFSGNCNECVNVFFSENLIGCTDCFGCVNLRNKQYYIFNQPYSREQYLEKMKEFDIGSFQIVEEMKGKLAELILRYPRKYMEGLKNFNVSGDYIFNSKNAFESYEVGSGENCKYCHFLTIAPTKDAYDFTMWGGGAERMYECMGAGGGEYMVRFSYECWASNVHDLEYCWYILSSNSDLFGCIGLKKKKYCILNKEYPEQEYRELLARIRKSMAEIPYVDAQGRRYEYGEFFPSDFSPYGYNETIAQEYLPLTKNEALRQGFKWRDQEDRNYGITFASEDMPDHIKDVKETILDEVIGCTHAGKCAHQCATAFRIVPAELRFYREMNLPLPRLCPNCRHYERLGARKPGKLWQRQCGCAGLSSNNGVYSNEMEHSHGPSPCPNTFETSYAPDRPEIVYCEQCYQAEVA